MSVLRKSILISVVLCLFYLPFISYAQNKTTQIKSLSLKTIAVLPFYNYTDSSMKYLSKYIPELIINNLAVNTIHFEVINQKAIIKEMTKRNLTPELLTDSNNSLKFLRQIKVNIGLTGRYIIQGNVIRINYYLIYTDFGEIIDGIPFEGKVDDDLLKTVDGFAKSSSDWLMAYILSTMKTELKGKDKIILKELIKKIKHSRLGFIIKNKWSYAGIILLFFYLLSKLTALFFEKVLKRFASKTKTKVDDALISISKRPFKWIIVFFGVKTAILPLGLSGGIFSFINNVTTAFIIMLIATIILKSFEILIHSWGRKVAGKIDSRINDDLVPLFIKMSKILIIILGALLILSNFGVKIGPLVASLGIAGFAIGFAVKDSLANIIGGIVLILDKSFVVGDKVTIDDDTGIICDVGLRNTKIKTYDNEVIVIPNGKLMNKKFKNYVLPDPTIRVVVNFGVAYGSNVDKVEEVVLDTIKTIDDVVDDPAPVVVFRQMADFSLDFQAKFWVPLWDNQYNKKREATKKIYNALNKAKINIPFPTHTVYLEK